MILSATKTIQHYSGSKKVYMHRNTWTKEHPIIEGGRWYISSDFEPMYHATDENSAIHAFDSVETFEHWKKYLKGKTQPED